MALDYFRDGMAIALLQGSVERSTAWSDERFLAPEPWVADALCAETDPEAFFPEKGGSVRGAKQICGACDVREQCLEYALRTRQQFGIWGGKSERERARMTRDRRAA